jgi:hypothetical protein
MLDERRSRRLTTDGILRLATFCLVCNVGLALTTIAVDDSIAAKLFIGSNEDAEDYTGLQAKNIKE